MQIPRQIPRDKSRERQKGTKDGPGRNSCVRSIRQGTVMVRICDPSTERQGKNWKLQARMGYRVRLSLFQNAPRKQIECGACICNPSTWEVEFRITSATSKGKKKKERKIF